MSGFLQPGCKGFAHISPRQRCGEVSSLQNIHPKACINLNRFIPAAEASESARAQSAGTWPVTRRNISSMNWTNCFVRRRKIKYVPFSTGGDSLNQSTKADGGKVLAGTRAGPADPEPRRHAAELPDPGRSGEDADRGGGTQVTERPSSASPSSCSSTSAPSPYKDRHALDREILSIGVPMLATMAADPIAGLVDSAYMGRASSSQLAAVGVALSVFNTVTKLFNVPLLAVTTSSVAKATGEASRSAAAVAAATATATATATAAATGQEPVTTAPTVIPSAVAAPVCLGGAAAAPAGAAAVAATPAPAAIEISSPGVQAAATATATAIAPAPAAAAAIVTSSLPARAATACLWLAALVGLVQGAVLVGAGPSLIRLWGVAAASPVYDPALAFLVIRGVGAPITILMLTLQGIYRGLQDTRTPFHATLVANALNIALAPLLIFTAHLGAPGAAAATVLAQAMPLALMVHKLSRVMPAFGQPDAGPRGPGVLRDGEAGEFRAIGGADERVQLLSREEAKAGQPGRGAGCQGRRGGPRGLRQVLAAMADVLPLFKPTGFLVLRSASVTATYAVATTLVAQAGAAITASHQICFQVWLACSLLADALAVAAQSLMSRDLGAGSTRGARQVAARVSSLSLGLGLMLAVLLTAGGRVLPGLFSSDPEVLRLVKCLFPIIAAMQPITVLAMAWDGLLYGVGGFRYAAISMAVAALPAMLVMQQGPAVYLHFVGPATAAATAATATAAAAAAEVAAGASGYVSGEEQLWIVWAGLSVLMLMRWLTIAVPYGLQIGPFRRLHEEGSAHGKEASGVL